MTKILRAFALLSISVAALLSTPVHAGPITVTVTGMQFDSPGTVRIKSVQAPANLFVYSGAFATSTSDLAGSFEAWCIDIFQSTLLNQPATFERSTGLTALGLIKTRQLQQLATAALDLVHDSKTSSAFQLAIWEIVNETSATFDLAQGNFTASNSSNGAIVLATEWLSTLSNSSSPNKYAVTVLASNARQDLAYFTHVPEPATIALLGLGLIGFAASRRKSAQ